MDNDDTVMGKLFATTVTNAKPMERDYKLADGAGLYLLVKTNGAKLWRLNYRHLGKQRTLSFGAWPDVGLAAARSQRDDARRMIAAENSFKAVAEEWLQERA